MRALGRRSIWSLSVGGSLVVLAVLLPTGGFLPAGGVALAEDETPAPQWVSHVSGLEVFGISSLRIHTKVPGVMWACVDGLGLSKSKDAGESWEVKQKGIDAKHHPTPRSTCVISLDPRDDKLIWVATQGRIYRSGDAGENWVDMTTNATSSWSWDRRTSIDRIRGVVVNPSKSTHIVAGTSTGGEYRGGVYESGNAGDSWEQIAGDTDEDKELFDAWPLRLDPKTDKIVVAGGTNGFWYSDDRGRTFRKVDPGKIGVHNVRHLTYLQKRGRDLYLCDGRGVWGSRDGGKAWAKKPNLAGDAIMAYLDPHSRKRVYSVLWDRGMHVAEDPRHVKWEQVGHADLEITGLLAHPRNEDLLYAVSRVTGLHASKDKGKTFEPIAASNLKPVVPPMVAAALHPVDKERGMAISAHGVVYLSKDRGQSWARAGRVGMETTTLFGDPTDENVWWAAGRLLLKSLDNGATWEVAYTPEDAEDRILGVTHLEDGSVYLALERARVIASLEKGGKKWKVTKQPSRSPGSWASSFAVDPTNPDHLLLATRSLARRWTPKDEEGGPFESWDGGKSWQHVTRGLFKEEGRKRKPKPEWNRGRWVAIDPATGVAFYASDGLGLYARLPGKPKAKPDDQPPWIDIGPGIPNLAVNVAVLRPLADSDAEEGDAEEGDAEEGDEEGGGNTALIVQGEGANDTRTFERTTTKRILARLEAVAAALKKGEEIPPVGEDGPLWEELPGPPARLADLQADPHVDGRLIGVDEAGSAGVLIYGVPGAGVPIEEGPGSEEEAGTKPPEGLLAFTAGKDGTIRVWGLREGKVYMNLPGHTAEVFAITLAPDESVIVTGGADQSMRVFDGMDGSPRELMLKPETYKATINAIAFHPDSRLVYACMQQNWAVLEWNVVTGESRLFEAHTGGVVSASVTPDGTQVITGSRDRTIRIWDIESASTVGKIDVGTEVLAMVLSPDGKKAYVGGRGTAVQVFDLATNQEIARADVQKAYVSDLAISPDGTRIYAAGDSGVAVLGTADLKPIPPALEGPTKAVFAVAVSQDGEWIVGGDAEGGLWLWQSGVAKPRWFSTTAHAGPIHSLALTPDKATEEEEEEEVAPPDEEPAPPGDDK